MSRDVSLDIRLRPLDTKRFVGDFVRKFSAWIPEGSPVRTTRDVLRFALADLDWLDRDFKYSRKTRCWTAHGDQVINARQEDDLREFIAWCTPYVDPKNARFKLAVEFGYGVYGIVTYKVEDGELVEWRREMREMESGQKLAPPRVSQIIDCLKCRRPKVQKTPDGYRLTFGLYGYGWSAVEPTGWNGAENVRCEIDIDGVDEQRQFERFDLLFAYAEKGVVSNVRFDGPLFSWDDYLWGDIGQLNIALAMVVREIFNNIMKELSYVRKN